MLALFRGTLPEPLDSLYKDENLVKAVQRILGTEHVALYMNRLLLKDREWNGAVAIHQDMPLFFGWIETRRPSSCRSRPLPRGTEMAA